MPDEWKDRAEEIVKARKNKEEAARKRQEKEKRAKYQQEHDVLVKSLQSRYKCHVPGCKNKPEHPSHEPGDADTPAGWWNWAFPGDFYRCDLCRNWTCEEHIHNGICMLCALDPKSAKRRMSPDYRPDPWWKRLLGL